MRKKNQLAKTVIEDFYHTTQIWRLTCIFISNAHLFLLKQVHIASFYLEDANDLIIMPAVISKYHSICVFTPKAVSWAVDQWWTLFDLKLLHITIGGAFSL